MAMSATDWCLLPSTRQRHKERSQKDKLIIIIHDGNNYHYFYFMFCNSFIHYYFYCNHYYYHYNCHHYYVIAIIIIILLFIYLLIIYLFSYDYFLQLYSLVVKCYKNKSISFIFNVYLSNFYFMKKNHI